MDFQPDQPGPAAHAHHHPAGLGVFDRVRDQVLRDPAQKGRVAVHHRRGRDKAQPQPRGLGHGRIFRAQPPEQRVQLDRLAVELDALAVQPADVKHRVHQLFHRFEGTGQPPGQFLLQRVQFRVRQRRQEQPRRRQRLQQVVAGRAQEAGLRAVGLFRGGAGHGQVAVLFRQVGQRLFQVAGAGQRLLFQRDGGLEHRPGRAAPFFQPVHPVDQHRDDAFQPCGAAGGVFVAGQHQAAGSGSISASPTKVWLTCIAPSCSPKVLKPKMR